MLLNLHGSWYLSPFISSFAFGGSFRENSKLKNMIRGMEALLLQDNVSGIIFGVRSYHMGLYLLNSYIYLFLHHP